MLFISGTKYAWEDYLVHILLMTLPPDEAGKIANLVVQTCLNTNKFVSSSIISYSIITFMHGYEESDSTVLC